MGVTRFGAPLEPLDLPEPAVPPGYASIDVLTCGVCATDLKIVAGRMPFSDPETLPHVPGHEVFGRVARTEPAGLLPTGAPVVVYQYRPCGRCDACRRGDEVLCDAMRGWTGFVDPGGFEARVVAAVDRLLVVPDGIGPVEAAPMTCALGSAFRAVVTRARVRAGARLAVIGLGGVGIHAALIAAASGADVLGVDLHAPTLEAAAELGVAAVDAVDADGPARTRAWPDGSLDAVVDTVASDETVALAVRLVRRGGTVVVVGHGPETVASIATRRLVLDEVSVVGSRYASRDELARAIALVAEGRVRPVVGLVRPLEDVNEVLDALERGAVVGRAVVDVAGVA
jgi:D-arabinose 1-dehydrogenase-like Zn-dependent alcohol dehydrogenase